MLATAALHREEIKARLRMKHGTLRQFEESKGLPPRSVRDVLRGRAVRRTAEAIANELGVPLQAVFPHYEDDEHSSTNGDDSAKRTDAHRLSGDAAGRQTERSR